MKKMNNGKEIETQIKDDQLDPMSNRAEPKASRNTSHLPEDRFYKEWRGEGSEACS